MGSLLSQDQLVEQFSDYVVKIAKQIKRNLPANIETEDLISYGMTGLIEAARRFNHKMGANFSTFSYYRIRGAIYDGLRAMGSLSRTEYKRLKTESKVNDYLENEYLYKNQNNLYQKKPEEELNKLAKKVQRVASIYLCSLDNQEIQGVKDNNQEDVSEKIARLELYEKMRMAIGKLPKNDQEIISSYYFDELSLEDVGKRLGLSKSWTSRKHAKAMERLSDLFFNLIKEESPKNKCHQKSHVKEKMVTSPF